MKSRRIKIGKLDGLFSKLVRERAGWHCERCMTYFPEGSGRQGLHASHVFGRGKHSVRWNPKNAFSLCMGCHLYFTAHPLLHHEFAVEKLDMTEFDALKLESNIVKQWTEKQKTELHQRLKDALTDMKLRRAMGHTGRLEFYLEAT